MTVSLPNPSSRLLRAAQAEQADLIRHRQRLGDERSRLLDELRQLDQALAATDRRLEVIAELAGGPLEAAAHDREPVPGGVDTASEAELRAVLRGPAVREAVVHVLLEQPEPIEALHYRRWYELLVEAGFEVAGKDPLAVFLTQLSRSPLVRKASAPGVYEVDRQAPLRIRQWLERLQAELREVTVAAPGPIELGAVRARRHELDVAISQQERALEEALRVLRAGEDQASAPGAARVG
ncbi:MAG: hypothetical protein ACRDPA_08270 [Solirubrobacteraceae bacterium]